MARLLATVLMTTGLALLGPSPAHATLSVTISATPTTLMAGESTTIKGKAVDAKPGSVVKLQRKVSGVWTTVTQKKVWSTRTYSFTIKPPKGYQYYRVRKPAQLGQVAATSPIVTLAVKWRPTIVIERTEEYGSLEYDHIRVTGAPDGALPALQRRYHPQAAWLTASPSPLLPTEDGLTRATVAGDAYELRYFLAGDGLRQAAYSAPRKVTDYYGNGASPIELNAEVSSDAEFNEGFAFYAEAGQELRLALEWEMAYLGQVANVYGPEGQLLLRLQTDEGDASAFMTTASGWHTIVLERDERYYRLWVTTTHQSTGELNKGEPLFGGWLLPGRAAEVTFSSPAGVVFSAETPYKDCQTQDLIRNGVRLAPLKPRVPGLTTNTWYLGQSGSYTLRSVPCRTGQVLGQPLLHAAHVVNVTAGGDAATAPIDREGQAVVARIPLVTGQRVVPSASIADVTYGSHGLTWYLFTPSGREIDSHSIPHAVQTNETGMHTLIGVLNRYGSNDWPLTSWTATFQVTTPFYVDLQRIGQSTNISVPGTGNYLREIGVRFPGSAGDLVETTPGLSGFLYNGEQILIGPNGQGIRHRFKAHRKVWLLPADGEYTIMSISGPGEVSAGVVHPDLGTPLVADGSLFQLPLPSDGRTVLSDVELVAGELYTLTTSDESRPIFEYDYAEALLQHGPSGATVSGLGPRGTYSHDFTAPVTGTYTLVLQNRGSAAKAVSVRLIPRS